MGPCPSSAWSSVTSLVRPERAAQQLDDRRVAAADAFRAAAAFSSPPVVPEPAPPASEPASPFAPPPGLFLFLFRGRRPAAASSAPAAPPRRRSRIISRARRLRLGPAVVRARLLLAAAFPFLARSFVPVRLRPRGEALREALDDAPVARSPEDLAPLFEREEVRAQLAEFGLQRAGGGGVVVEHRDEIVRGVGGSRRVREVLRTLALREARWRCTRIGGVGRSSMRVGGCGGDREASRGGGGGVREKRKARAKIFLDATRAEFPGPGSRHRVPRETPHPHRGREDLAESRLGDGRAGPSEGDESSLAAFSGRARLAGRGAASDAPACT